MKLFVRNRFSGVPLYLSVVASSRYQLANMIGSPWFTLHNQNFHVNEVIAESTSSNIAPSAIVGGIIGMLAGPAGILIGGLAGGLMGNEGDKAESQKVTIFNNSQI